MTDKAKLYAVKNDEGEWLDEDRLWGPGAWATSDKDEREKVAKCYGGHVVALTEEQKVKLPREVGEDLEDWLKADSIDSIITNLVWLTDDHMAVRDWWESTLGATYLIADMARYGWEAEKETLYNVKVPHTKYVWYYKSLNEDLLTISDKGLCSEFTESEIEHYGLQDCERVEVTDDED